MIGRVGEGGRKQTKQTKKPNAVFSRAKNKTIQNKKLKEMVRRREISGSHGVEPKQTKMADEKQKNCK